MTETAPRQIPVRDSDFDFETYDAGSEGIVATAKVPKGHVWHVPTGEPLEIALITRTAYTVSASAAGEAVNLSPEAPLVDWMDDPTAGNYTKNAYLVAYDETDPANPVQVTESSGPVSFTGNFTDDGDYVKSFTVDNSEAAEKTLAVYTVARYGYTRIQKRNPGKSNVAQELQTETSTTFAFSDPNAPDTDRQLTWESVGKKRGTLPPKFRLDLVYYDESNSVNLTDAEDYDNDGNAEAINPVNIAVNVPMIQRGLKEDEDPEQLRRQVTAHMATSP